MWQWEIHWFIQAYLFLWKRVSAGHRLATDISAVLLWLRTSSVQASCHNIVKSKIMQVLENMNNPHIISYICFKNTSKMPALVWQGLWKIKLFSILWISSEVYNHIFLFLFTQQWAALHDICIYVSKIYVLYYLEYKKPLNLRRIQFLNESLG
jgi:hypothetical protein